MVLWRLSIGEHLHRPHFRSDPSMESCGDSPVSSQIDGTNAAKLLAMFAALFWPTKICLEDHGTYLYVRSICRSTGDDPTLQLLHSFKTCLPSFSCPRSAQRVSLLGIMHCPQFIRMGIGVAIFVQMSQRPLSICSCTNLLEESLLGDMHRMRNTCSRSRMKTARGD